MIPPQPLVVIAVGAIGFSVVNAAAEELMWRGIVMTAVERATGRPNLAVAIQAVSFGFVHYSGFPRGWIGVALATIYGAMMGTLRRVSGGLLAPWGAHVFADLTIAAILATLALR